jgi:ankyrin repeat protein
MHFPLELLQEIGAHLDFSSYQNLRISSKWVPLPFCQRLKRQEFRQRLLLTEESVDGQIAIETSLADDEILYLLTYRRWCSEWSRVIESSSRISPQAIENCFWILAQQLEAQYATGEMAAPFQLFIQKGTFCWELAKVKDLNTMVSFGIERVPISDATIDLFLHLSILCGNVRIFRQLAHRDRITNPQEILRFCCCHGYTEVAQIMLEDFHADPTAQFHAAWILACGGDSLRLVELLLKHPGLLPHANDNEAICVASAHGNIEIVQRLLRIPSIDPSCGGRDTALLRALREENREVVKLLVRDERVDPTTDHCAALLAAAYHGWDDILQCLLREFASTEEDVSSAIFLACCSSIERVEIVAMLLQYIDVAPFEQGNEWLVEAVANGHYKIAQYFLENDVANAFFAGCHVFIAACRDGCLELVQYCLMIPDFDASVRNNLALIEASANGHIDIVQLLLQQPKVHPSATCNFVFTKKQYFQPASIVADPIYGDYYCFRISEGHDYLDATALEDWEHRFEVKRFEESQEIVVEVNDDYDDMVYQNTAIRAAIQSGYEEIAILLLERPHVDPTWNENELLRCALELDCIQVARKLLAHPLVDPSIPQQLPLRLACFRGHAEIVKLLLNDSRVLPGWFDNEALQIACQEGHSDIFEVLLGDSRVNPSISIKNSLLCAAYSGSEQMIQSLLAQNAPTLDLIHLETAVSQNLGEGFELFVPHCPKLSEEQIDLFLQWAITCNHGEVVQSLLHMHPNLDRGTEAAMRLAFSEGLFDMIRVLLGDYTEHQYFFGAAF